MFALKGSWKYTIKLRQRRALAHPGVEFLMKTKTHEHLSFAIAGALLCSVLTFGLMVALLSICMAYVLARGLANHSAARPFGAYAPVVSAALVGLLPFVFLGFLVAAAGYMAPSLKEEFAGLSERMVALLDAGRQALPDIVASKVPSPAQARELVVEYLQERAGAIAAMGKTWFLGVLQLVVGTVIGVLLFAEHVKKAPPVGLGLAVARRADTFIGIFRSIVTAQLVIAVSNTLFTAIYLFILLPLFGIALPYSMALVVLTFLASLLPVVGNLLVNSVLTLVALSVSPAVAAGALAFLVIVHKAEYIINAAVIGEKTAISIWEMLVAIALGEAAFGVAGVVAAPLYYAYLKQEAKNAGLLQA